MRLRIQLQSNALAGLRCAATLLALAGCGAGHEADCLKSNGSIITQRRALDSRLTVLMMYDNVDVIIVPDTDTYAEVRAGENVIDDIKLTMQGNNQLVVQNTSRCNWARSYDTPREVRLHVAHLKDITQKGYGLLTTDGQWQKDTLFVHSTGVGDINMNVNCVYLFVDVYDAGDMTLHGQAKEFHPNLGSNGFLFASDLRATDCYFHVYRENIGDAHVRANRNLGGFLDGRGTLYYTGNPVFIDTKGTGKLTKE